MCYAHPLPRCSAHASSKLAIAKDRLDKITDVPGSPGYHQAVQEHREALREFLSTPAGFRSIEAKIAEGEALGADDNILNSWREKLQALKEERAAAIASIRDEDRSAEDADRSQAESAPVSPEGSHWVRCDGCGQFVGPEHVCPHITGEHKNFDPDGISTWTPVQVDERLSGVLAERYELSYELNRQEGYLTDIKKYLDPENTRYYREHEVGYRTESKERLEAKIEELNARILSNLELADSYEREYIRRGGWTRAFIVVNSNGHVHSDMSCSTCFSTTQFAWLARYSGKSEKQIVSDAGERACTVCYPSAPVEVKNAPTKIFTPKEEEQQALREERAKKKADREAKKQQNAITTPDGSRLEVKWARGTDPVDTLTRATSMYVELVTRKRMVDEGLIPRNVYRDYDDDNIATLGRALQHKLDVNVEGLQEHLRKRLQTKYRSMKREWGV